MDCNYNKLIDLDIEYKKALDLHIYTNRLNDLGVEINLRNMIKEYLDNIEENLKLYYTKKANNDDLNDCINNLLLLLKTDCRNIEIDLISEINAINKKVKRDSSPKFEFEVISNDFNRFSDDHLTYIQSLNGDIDFNFKSSWINEYEKLYIEVSFIDYFKFMDDWTIEDFKAHAIDCLKHFIKYEVKSFKIIDIEAEKEIFNNMEGDL